jgi:predicted RNase H-like nuclease (RuvC/YqgF family)
MKKANRSINECKLSIEVLDKKIYHVSSQSISIKTSNNSLLDKVSELEAKMESQDKFTKAYFQALQNRIEDQTNLFRKEILKCKKEIIESPTGVEQLKDHLENEIACHKIDVHGIMRELQVYKKEMFIVEKKLESIFTDIIKLKGAKK